MANKISTVRTYPLNGAVDFTITFEYLARKFVQVTLIGKDRKELVLNQDYRFTTKTQITTSRAWTAADGYQLIEIRRFTSATDRLVDFADGSILRAYDLNISQIQTLHVAEEARDLTADTIGVNNDGHLDARGRRIVNVADGIAPGDAVTIGQMDRWTGSASSSAAKAKVSETNAKVSENNAKVSENNAKTSEINSKASETLAEKWASNPEDTLVSDTHYSALHYSIKSAASASESSLSASAASKSAADALTSANDAANHVDEAKAEADKLAQFNDIVDRMNSVAVAQVGNPELHNSRTYAKPGTVFADGQTLSRDLYPTLWAAIQARQVPVVSESIWLSSPSDRGCFTEGDGTTTFRVPDYNGVTAGSIKAPAMRGDGGGVDNGGFTVGKVQESALPNITASVQTGHSLALFRTEGQYYEGAAYAHEELGGSLGSTGTSIYSKGFRFDANRVWSGYTDGLTEARVNANVFVWVIRTHGVVNNPGSVDAAVLASRVEQVYTELRSSVASVDPEWLPWSDPKVTSLIEWEPTIDPNSNIWCRLFPTHMEIKGIIRKTFSASNKGFMYFKQFPPGFTSASAIYSPAVLAGSVAAYIEGEQETIPTTDYTTFRVSISSGTYMWLMVNMDILFDK